MLLTTNQRIIKLNYKSVTNVIRAVDAKETYENSSINEPDID